MKGLEFTANLAYQHDQRYSQGADAEGDMAFRYPAEYPPRILED